MAFQRIVQRTLPNGTISWVNPFHITLEGMEDLVLCRNDEDYDIMEKYIFVCARRKNVLVIIHIVMSNHAHIAVLALDKETALAFGNELKRSYSQYFSWKYNERKVLLRTTVDVRLLDSDGYLRNALAYIPRNALDAASRMEDYKWSSYQAMFSNGKNQNNIQEVKSLSNREICTLFRTHDNLKQTGWWIDVQGKLCTYFACDHAYLQSAFYDDQAFYLRTIGNVNMAEMRVQLIESGRRKMNDIEFLSIVESFSQKWFQKHVGSLSLHEKSRLLPYIFRTYRTSVAQLSRCFQIEKDLTSRLLRHIIRKKAHTD